MTNRRLLKIWAAALTSLLAIFVATVPSATPVGATTPSQWYANLSGTPGFPTPFCSAEFDCIVHDKGPLATLAIDAMDAQHGSDCSKYPAYHNISQYTDFQFLCNNHIMTASNSVSYAETVYTAAYLVDISGGATATVTYSVSTLRLSARDWYDVFFTPYANNLVLPISPCCTSVDLQGPPQYGFDIVLANRPPTGTDTTDTAFQVCQYNNFTSTCGNGGGTIESKLPQSASDRTPFQMVFNSTHFTFGIPACPVGAMGCNGSGTTGCPTGGCAAYWFYNNVAFTTPLTQTQFVFQITHHSYHPGKACDDLGQHGPYTYVNPAPAGETYSPACAPDTWHWGANPLVAGSGIGISSAVPFTVDKASPALIGPFLNPAGTVTSVTLATAAPSNGYLRFSGLGTISVSFDGGQTYQAAVRQTQSLNDPLKFSSYWMPIPAGTSTVYFKTFPVNNNSLAGMERDITVWSNP